MNGGALSQPRVTAPAVGTAVAAGVLTVGVQIAYPLLDGSALHAATRLVVVLFCATSVLHAGAVLGARAAVALLAVAAGIGLGAETLGVHTGVPFGSYHYTGTLTPQVLGVPVIVPLAWAMMAYPSLVLGRVLAGRLSGLARRALVALAGGWTLAAWDLFLDPQMVSAGYWRFDSPSPGLPGLTALPAAALADPADAASGAVGIPWTNHLGWLIVGVVLVAALDAVLPSPARPASGVRRAALAVPAVMLAWTWLGSALALGAFLDLPVPAAWGTLAMGLTVGPFLRRVVPRLLPDAARATADGVAP
ncbi:MAG: carotenoid biosynthesis protein [Kineosporiaceae bacterium]